MQLRTQGPSGATRHETTPLERWLYASQLLFNVGFYLVLPFLALHLERDLGLSAALVGLVIGIRTFSQQGMFVVGGALVDRLGPRGVAVVGCALRVLGFVLLGLGTSVGAVVAGAVLTGAAGALFSPAVESALAREAVRRIDDEEAVGLARRAAFARFAVAGEIGAMVGPVLGGLLSHRGFATGCLVSAALFAVMGVLHARLLPAAAEAGGTASWPRVGHVLADRRLLVFVAAYSTYLLAYNQLYLLVPRVLATRLDVDAAGQVTAVLFAVASLVIALGQVPLTRALERFAPARRLVGGFALMAIGAGAAGLTTDRPVIAAALFTLVFTLGQMVVTPVAGPLVADHCRDRDLATHLGLLATGGGVATLLGTPVLGALSARDPAYAWLALGAVLVTSALVLRTRPLER